ncbi:MAG: GH92 family glycosyl hydrolase [Ferruginibacter sp.]
MLQIKRVIILLSIAFFLTVNHAISQNLIQYVNPLAGTAKMGHTYPGATVPFGAVQLSPDTDTIPFSSDGKYNNEVYKYCAGYQYDDPTIVGFSHTHFSGTGHSDLGDFLIMPTVGRLQLNPGTKEQPADGYRSRFSHMNEIAEPNYYKVLLDDDHILAELTTSTRVGFHQYTFPASDSAHIILDMQHGIYNYAGKNVWTYLHVINDTLVTGYRQTNGWARNRTVYFAMVFSKPFYQYGNENSLKNQSYRGFWGRFSQNKNFPEMAAQQIRAYFDFKTIAGEKIKIKFSLSPVSMGNALINLQEETPGWDFDKVKQQGQLQWEKELSKIEITATDKEVKQNFYTAMYHAAIMPTVYMDLNREYKGIDQNVHNAKGFTNYTSFSLWDTYRAFHPYLNIISPSRNTDIISSMLAHYDQSPEHMLPIWSHYANENWCMSGYHSVSVIADAIIKGTFKGNVNHALDACIATATRRSYDGLGYYMDIGYIPSEKNGVSVSSTLEYAYDDWCIAQIAKKMKRTDVYDQFMKRSMNWKHVYDASIGFMRPKLLDGTFKKEFDVLKTDGQGFIEGNAWNYSLYVPQDPAAMIAMMGGKKRFADHLDSLFTMHLPDEFFAETEDITREGIIGNYVHGNEPAHHAAYLYNWTDRPWKTAEMVRLILKKQYHPAVDGLSGNDDCGQMSAWYIFSALGFYPVTPGSDQYQFGSPAVDKATIKLENGRSFFIEAKDQSEKNIYVQKIMLNDKQLDRFYITHNEITSGGRLVFYMGPVPKK